MRGGYPDSFAGPRRIGLEVKLSTVPTVTRGFHEARKDTRCDEAYVVFPRGEPFPMGDGVEAMPLDPFLRRVIEPIARR